MSRAIATLPLLITSNLFSEPGQRGEDRVLHVHLLHHEPGGRADGDVDGHRGQQQRGDQPPLH